MSDHDAKVRKLRMRRNEEAATVSESLVTRFLEEVIEELQAEVDRAKEGKHQPPAPARSKATSSSRAGKTVKRKNALQ